ncbi:hypothetical protein Pen01_44510 [Phytomonospora endophytica]|nr:hypothetical protein Pen01_44510 [Phytomonospora endophytica]
MPVLACTSAEETLEFYRALGFASAYAQTRPYLYLILRWSGMELHFGKPLSGVDTAGGDVGGCVVMVDAVAPYHAAFTEAMRAKYGKVPATGRPRITRHRPGASRFTLVDPAGNKVVFVQRDEPLELDYGGSRKLKGLARALDNARVLREFKNDDRAASRALRSALRRHGDEATAVERALALTVLIELAIALGEDAEIGAWSRRLAEIPLTGEERARVDDGVTPGF